MSQIIAQVRGYAAVWNVIDGVGANGLRTAFRPGSIRFDHYDIACNVSHLEHSSFASTCDHSLRLFEDGHGLGFECDIPLSVHGAAVRNMLNSGERWGCSGSYVVTEDIVDDGEEVQTVIRGKLRHIGLTGAPACRSTRCWLASEDQLRLGARERRLRDMWAAGHEAADRQAADDRALLRDAPRLREEFLAAANRRARVDRPMQAASRASAKRGWQAHAMSWPQVESAARRLGLLG